MGNYPKVKICDTNEDPVGYSYKAGNKKWNVKTLIKAVRDQGCDEFDLPLAGIDLLRMPWEISDASDLIYHFNRVMKADFEHPIILSWDGFICDGWHRVVRAIVEGKTSIRAVRLNDYIQPDFVVSE